MSYYALGLKLGDTYKHSDITLSKSLEYLEGILSNKPF